MFPIRSSWVFKSRWMALLWAAGILWFALDVAGSSEPPPDNITSSEATAP
jgi:hypothetical protein